jgi:peptidoglycan/xylan/chitin deacetylase (PgdA/CDA1 family)
MKREVFDAVGGFDVRFAASGTYGNEDLDIGYRIVARGYRVEFNPRAVSHQYYATPAAVNLRQYRQMGHADVAFARKHPELTKHLFETIRNETREHLKIRDMVLRWPRLAGLVVALLGPVFGRRIDRGRTDVRTEWWFFTLRTVQYWRGVHEAGGIPRPQPVRVLCYHSISDLGGDPVLADYGITERLFRWQIERLRRSGYRFIAARELVAMLHGHGGVPRDAVLVTFDDAYRDFLTGALPVLREHGIQAATFVVTRNVGKTNSWDEAVGARRLQLLGRDELAQCAGAGIDIGAHSRTHRMLTSLEGDELRAEIAGSLDDLEEGEARPAGAVRVSRRRIRCGSQRRVPRRRRACGIHHGARPRASRRRPALAQTHRSLSRRYGDSFSLEGRDRGNDPVHARRLAARHCGGARAAPKSAHDSARSNRPHAETACEPSRRGLRPPRTNERIRSMIPSHGRRAAFAGARGAWWPRACAMIMRSACFDRRARPSARDCVSSASR